MTVWMSSIFWTSVWVWSPITSAVAQEVNTTDLTGYWVSEGGVKVFIPVMRDGRMPVVLMNRRPTVLLGDWDWASQTLKVNNTHFGISDDKLTMSNQRTTQTHTLKRQVTAHPSDGYWFHENKGELIVADDGKKVWAIHIPPSQEAIIRKTKWKTLDEEMRAGVEELPDSVAQEDALDEIYDEIVQTMNTTGFESTRPALF